MKTDMNTNTKKIIAGALAVAGIYLLYRYFRKPKGSFEPSVSTEPPPPYVPTRDPKDSYPLKKGSKGANVKSLQELILKIDSTLLPKFGADGDFGSETEAAVQRLLNKTIVDANDYGKLLEMYNRKTFPMMFPEPKPNLPTFGGLPTYKPPFGF